MILNVRSVIIILSLALCSELNICACEWYSGTGEVSLTNFTAVEAASLAKRMARAAAVEKSCGSYVSSSTIVRDHSVVSDFIKSSSKGYIVGEKIIRWEQDKYQNKETDQPIPILRVLIDACVEKAKPIEHTSLGMEVSINKNAFVEGEEARITVSVNTDSYVHVFNIDANDMVTFYNIPPVLRMPVKVVRDRKYVFPPRGVRIEMALPNGYKRATEAFVIVASKRSINMELKFQEGHKMNLEKFNKIMSSIDEEKIEKYVTYTVEAKMAR